MKVIPIVRVFSACEAEQLRKLLVMTNDCYIPSFGTRGSRKTGDVSVGMMFSIELPMPWQMLAATASGFGQVMAMVRMTMLWA